MIIDLRAHVFSCDLCFAKGFICEICRNEKDIIFPFNIQTTSSCSGLFLLLSNKMSGMVLFLVCQSCYHIHCHENNRYYCPKCQRAKHRKFVKQIYLIIMICCSIYFSSVDRSITPTNDI